MYPSPWNRCSSAARAAQATLGHPVYAATCAILLLVALSSGLLLWQYWLNVVQDAENRTSTLAFLLAEQTTRTFQAVDLTLTGLEPLLTAAPLPDHAPAVEHVLARRVAELDFLYALFVTDSSGRITQSAGPSHADDFDLSGRGIFQALARDPGKTFVVGHPWSHRPGMLGAIPAARRLETPDGRFAGIVVAVVEPKYFRDFYRNLDLGRRASIDLYQDNGSILLASTAEPAMESEGESMDLPPAALHEPLSGVLPAMMAPWFGDYAEPHGLRAVGTGADQKLVAYHRAQTYPLVVAVGVDRAELRARWWRVAAPTLTASAVAMVLGLALAVLMVRRLEERRAARARAVTVQKLEALGQMTASLSHDFRNILAVMTSTLRLLRKRGPDETILQAAEQAIERGSGLVTQLLAFSHRQELQLREVDLATLLGSLEAVLGHAAGPEVTVEIAAAPDLPSCRLDQTQFDAALMNLVVNARQAMPQGGRITITTRFVPARPGHGPDIVELAVSDTGSGIAPADLKRIFEPFFTTKGDRGTGLGLSQVYGFMRQIGGDVTVSSLVGVGTTFRLAFPVAAETAELKRPADRPKAAARGAAAGPSVRTHLSNHQ